LELFVNVPLAPITGAVKVTIALLTGLLPLSTTFTCSGFVNGLPTTALWPFPAVARTEAGAPVVFVRSKFAGVGTPAIEAVTV
jgi:hypothetical protein